MNDAVIKLKNISTTCISDALDYFGVNGAIKGLYALEQNMRVTGRVFTVKYTLVDADIEASAGNYSDFVSENDVIVIDNDGRDFCTVWGDMYALAAANLKVSGVIINGCCRDVDEIIAMQFPTFSRSVHMQSGRHKVKVMCMQEPITIDDVVIKPGDCICADSNGVIVVPENLVDDVAKLAIAIDENDKKILSAIKNGMNLTEAKKLFKCDTFANELMGVNQ